MDGKARDLKEEGNRHFQTGDYAGAEGFYSKAIVHESQNPVLYTNRAMARLKLGLWEAVIMDCQECLSLSPDNMKAFYYLSQAQLALNRHDDALASALHAHELCAKTNDKSLGAVTAQVLKCKKDRWDAMEKRRAREGQQLEREMLQLMAQLRDQAMEAEADQGVRVDISREWSAKMDVLSATFEKAREADQQKRTVPEWVIDDISFQIMVDPVVTKTGKSYERSSIMEHLRRHPNDPLTREPLVPSELRPNLALKQACEEFIKENGWAVDW